MRCLLIVNDQCAIRWHLWLLFNVDTFTQADLQCSDGAEDGYPKACHMGMIQYRGKKMVFCPRDTCKGTDNAVFCRFFSSCSYFSVSFCTGAVAAPSLTSVSSPCRYFPHLLFNTILHLLIGFLRVNCIRQRSWWRYYQVNLWVTLASDDFYAFGLQRGQGLLFKEDLCLSVRCRFWNLQVRQHQTTWNAKTKRNSLDCLLIHRSLLPWPRWVLVLDEVSMLECLKCPVSPSDLLWQHM